jgi:hypothetical protein
MVYTHQNISRDIKPKFYFEDLKNSKDNCGSVGSIDSKNLSVLSKQFFSKFTDKNRQRNLSVNANIVARAFANANVLTGLENHLISIADVGLKITLARIKELQEDEEADEYGEIIIPTEYAIEKAIELVSKAAKLIPAKFFKAWVSTEDSGGVSLTWSKPVLEKEVRLVIPPTPDRKIYLYHEKSAEYGVEYNVSAKTLGYWLSWCNSK